MVKFLRLLHFVNVLRLVKVLFMRLLPEYLENV